ncbi:MAG: TusE/DsrC/DsvC family sulfur relay protein [Clostridia bacterium]|nr:TusE/DsrC/DsvC family sulfur relay protein [Clostridia bacterium]
MRGGLNFFSSSLARREFMIKGPTCVKDEQIWEQLVHEVLTHLEKVERVTDEHYIVMGHVRKYYLEKGRAPSIFEICTLTGFSMKQFLELFPDWPHTLFNIDFIVCTVLDLPLWNIEKQ